MPASPQPGTAPPRGPWCHALEGGLAVLAAVAVMAVTAWAGLLALGAGAIAPLSRLVPTVLSMAFGGAVGLESAPSAAPAAGGGLLGALGGSGGGLGLSVDGEVRALPLMLTFLGTAVLATVFFRPLRRRSRPLPALLWARAGGALSTAAVLLPVLALLGRGTARLPGSVTERLGAKAGGAGGAMGGLGGLGAGTGGSGKGLGGALSSVAFHSDVVSTAFLGVLGVCAVLGIGCVAARRTSLPRPVALSRMRLKWHPVASTLTGMVAVACFLVLALAVLAGAASLAGREQAARAAGALLLAGPGLLAVLLTSGLGASWEAAFRRDQGNGAGMLGMLGGEARGAGAGKDRSLAVGDWSGAGAPLWLIGLVLLLVLLVLAGYLIAARTPARSAREEADALLGRHLELALRTGVAAAGTVLLCCLTARVSLRMGINVMGGEMGAVTAGLDAAVRMSALTGFVTATAASYAGSRLHGLRAAHRPQVPGPPRPGPRRRTMTSESSPGAGVVS
ncbi:streptophobe family protein [Streptomyces misionensis]|uniref:streptophobe family protein n=1 Tax=Streptomyces misionensis TaxID=67331 RepID=UPI001645AB10|nr:streptophobe family protein [Streptomyces misionensis]